jgi:hypothetical protein
MLTILTKNMKKIKQVLQESVKIGHLGSLKGVELLKIDVEEAITFHNRERMTWKTLPKK